MAFVDRSRATRPRCSRSSLAALRSLGRHGGPIDDSGKNSVSGVLSRRCRSRRGLQHHAARIFGPRWDAATFVGSHRRPRRVRWTPGAQRSEAHERHPPRATKQRAFEPFTT